MSTSDSQPAADNVVDDISTSTGSKNTAAETDPRSGQADNQRRTPEPLAYLPAGDLSADDVRQILARGDRQARRQVLAELLRYAPWDELWDLLPVAQVAAELPHLDLPESLTEAWRKWLDSALAGADEPT